MAKKATGTPTPKKARRVLVPAGHDYLIVKPGETFYLIEPDGKLPQHLQEAVDKREQTAYEKGIKDGQVMQERNMRSFTLEETISMVLQMMRQHDAKGQNQVLAVVMCEMGKAYDARMKALAEDMSRLQELHSETEKAFAGFHHIRNGAFEKMNIA
jgi:hypothetical protein